LIVFNSLRKPMGDSALNFAGECLGLTEQEAYRLFVPLAVSDWRTLTPKIAADTLRNFIATGEVDWVLNGAPLCESKPFP